MMIKHQALTALALMFLVTPGLAQAATAKKEAEPAATEAPVAEETPAPEELPAKAEAPADEAAASSPEQTAAETAAPAAEEGADTSGSHGAGPSHHTAAKIDWSFNGPFGTYDKAALQRGFLVYKNVCSSCHALKKLYYRNLTGIGYSEAQIKTIAAEYTAVDGPNDEGEMFERPARPSDHIKRPFENDKAAMYANGGALPPDLSLITKARHDGPNYVYGILTSYAEPPAGVTLSSTQHFNLAKHDGLKDEKGNHIVGGILAMAPPLSDGQVPYEDGTPQTVDQYAKDVTQFLTWAAEPEMEHRKQMGAKVVIFLLIFALIMYATKRKIWEKLH